MELSIRCGLILTLVMAIAVGCSGLDNPSMPSMPDEAANTPVLTANSQPVEEAGSHSLWSYYLIYVDTTSPGDIRIEAVPLRQIVGHWNALSWLEQAPCTYCLQVVGITPSGYGTQLVDIKITHPFTNANLTGFDVRGIAMFSGSHSFPMAGLNTPDRNAGDGELVNADGYTTLYNYTTTGSGPDGLEGYIQGNLASATPPDALLNGYKRFVSQGSANTRNAFYVSESIIEIYEIDMPDGPFVFGYAVDTSWVPTLTKPVTDPIADFPVSANCPEPWKIEITEEAVSGGLTSDGGATKLLIDVFDWQGRTTHKEPVVECPEIFTGALIANYLADGAGYSRWEVTVENELLAHAGDYKCLISVEDNENDPANKPWLDLTAYQIPVLKVSTESFPIDVTPPWLNFTPTDVCFDGNYAYTVGNINGLHIFDISDPVNPLWVNAVETPDDARAVYVTGGYAYVTVYEDWPDPFTGLLVIDISLPESAHVVNSIEIPGCGSYAVTVSDGFAHVAASNGGLVIIDVDPADSAFILSTVDEEISCAFDVAILDGYAYVPVLWLDSTGGGYTYSLKVIDIDPPEQAHVVKTVETPTSTHCVDVSDGYAFVGVRTTVAGFQVVDIDPPEMANIIHTVDTQGLPYYLTVEEGYAYVSCAGETYNDDVGLQIFDIGDPEFSYSAGWAPTPEYIKASDVKDEYAYVTTHFSGLHVIDINPPETSVIVNSIHSSGSPFQVSVDENDGYLYVAAGVSGLQVIDIDPPESAHYIDPVYNLGTFNIACVENGYAYVAYDGQPEICELAIIDIDPPESMQIVNSLQWTGTVPYGIDTSDGLLYVVFRYNNYTDRLHIIDVDPPESAAIINTSDTLGYGGIDVSDGLLYLAYEGVTDWIGVSGFQIIDIDPAELAHSVSDLDLAGYPKDVAVSQDYAYVAGFDKNWEFGYLHVIDVDPPELLEIVDTVETPDIILDVAVAGDRAFVADRYNGLQIINISSPFDAFIETTFNPPGNDFGVEVSTQYAYVVGSGGVWIIKL